MNDFSSEVVPDGAAIAQLTERADDFLRRAGVEARPAHHVLLVLEEILTNLMMHSEGDSTPAAIHLSVAPDRVRGEIVDQSPGFDPRSAPEPDLAASAEQRSIGGLGLHLVRKLTAELDYVSTAGRNRLGFSVLRHPPMQRN